MDRFLKEDTSSKEGAAMLIASRKAVLAAEEELITCKTEERCVGLLLPETSSPSASRRGASRLEPFSSRSN